MEASNSFDKLGILEEKINHILESLKIEKENNLRLQREKEELIARLNEESKNINQLNQERFLTRDVVDELIKNIDRISQIESKNE